jgi:putative ABC transport system permease protein
MFSLTIKGLLAHKLRFALTGVAVILGVAFMAGTFVLTDTMSKSFDDLFATSNMGIDAVVQHEVAFDSSHGTERDRVPATTVDTVAATPGVAGAEGTVMGFAQLVGKDGKPMGNPGMGAPTLGMNWVTNPELNPFRVAEGRAPVGPDEVVIDRTSATKGSFAIGDPISVISQAAPHDYTVVGIVTFGDADSLAGASIAGFETPVAQQLLAVPGQFDTIVVKAADGTTPAALVANLDKTVGKASGVSGIEVLTGAEQTAAQQADVQKGLSFLSQFLLAFAFVSLFVGTFIIYNTFTILVAQRSREMALLRAIGARRRQVMGSVIVEAAAIGLVASAVGIAAGLAMAKGLEKLLSAVGFELPSGDMVIAPRTLIVSVVVGVGVTLASAVIPARKASKVPPIAALRDVAVEHNRGVLRRSIIGLAVLFAGAALFGIGVTGGVLATVGLGAVVAIVGVFVLGPVIARPLAAVIGWPLATTGMTGRFARQNAMRNPRRTSSNAAALMIGVALVAFISILAASTKASTSDTLEASMRGDFVVNAGTSSGGVSTAIEPQLASLSTIDAVSPIRLARATVVPADAPASTTDPTTTTAADVAGIDPTTIDQVFDGKVTAGQLHDVDATGVAVKQDEAEAKHLGIGDQVTATFKNGVAVPLNVTAIFSTALTGSGGSSYLVSLDTFQANAQTELDSLVLLKVRDGVTPAAARAEVEQVLAGYPNAELQDQAEAKAAIEKEIDQMLNLIYGLLALAIVIALIGIANTLALSVHERTRELGLLRGIGMTRRQVRGAIRWESVIIALLGTGLGFALGIGGAWGLGKALATKGMAAFVVPPTTMTAIAIMAVGAGVVAALGPARRAGRLDILEAIATD